jgi:putative MATE family efflux protein
MTADHSSKAARLGHIYGLGVPIFFGQLSQGLTSLVDTALVAGLDDSHALAAVAIGSYANFLACALVLGVSVGVQTLVARRVGEEQHRAIAAPLMAGIHIALLVGLISTLFFYAIAPLLMQLLNNNPQVYEPATDYFRYRVLSATALGLSFACKGYLSGIKRTTQMMTVQLVTQVTNILCSYALIYGLGPVIAMGAAGSGLGSTLGVLAGLLCYGAITFYRRGHWLLFAPGLAHYRAVIALALPNSFQHLLTALGMSVFYFLLGKISVDALALGHALTNIALFVILPAMAFGIAATTLVSQALGSDDACSAYRWGWESLLAALPVLLLLALPLLMVPELIIHYFIPDNLALQQQAITPTRIVGLLTLAHGGAIILSQSMLGAGDNQRVFAVFTGLQWGLMLPVAAALVLLFEVGISGIWLWLLLDRSLQTLVFVLLWRQQRWGYKPL